MFVRKFRHKLDEFGAHCSFLYIFLESWRMLALKSRSYHQGWPRSGWRGPETGCLEQAAVLGRPALRKYLVSRVAFPCPMFARNFRRTLYEFGAHCGFLYTLLETLGEGWCPRVGPTTKAGGEVVGEAPRLAALSKQRCSGGLPCRSIS